MPLLFLGFHIWTFVLKQPTADLELHLRPTEAHTSDLWRLRPLQEKPCAWAASDHWQAEWLKCGGRNYTGWNINEERQSHLLEIYISRKARGLSRSPQPLESPLPAPLQRARPLLWTRECHSWHHLDCELQGENQIHLFWTPHRYGVWSPIKYLLNETLTCS